MTELAPREGSSLALRSDQEFWTDKQKAALAQLGVGSANNADLAVFFHVSQRSGLDPFARQIYMIERQGKQTIQTGIDGFRVIGHRAASRAGEHVSMSSPQWCGSDGVWHDMWIPEAHPVAAKVVVYRDGQPFPGVAMYREYVQRDRQGNATGMWKKMPANQLAKCAEAQAWRKAYPQDMAGIYVDDEMHQASNPDPGPPPTQRVTAAEIHRSRPARQPKLPTVIDGDGDEPTAEPVSEGQTTLPVDAPSDWVEEPPADWKPEQ